MSGAFSAAAIRRANRSGSSLPLRREAAATASRAARAADTGTDGDGVTESIDSALSFSLSSPRSGGGAGRAGGGEVRADAARGVTVAGALPEGPNGARPPAARDPAPEAAAVPALGLAVADPVAPTDPTDIRGAPAGMPPAAAGATAADESSREGPEPGAP